MNIASVELSTTAAKCILFSLKNGIIAETAKRYSRDVADGPSQAPYGILTYALDVLREIVIFANDNGYEIDVVGLTGIWHSLLLLDGSRQPVGNIMTWLDLAGKEHTAAKRANLDFAYWFYQKTGCLVHASYPVWKWNYLALTHPEAVAKTKYFSSQIEFIFERFTCKTAVSRTLASGTGFLNIHTLEWDEELLDMSGLRAEQLGQLVEPFYTAPMRADIARWVGLPTGVPVAVGCPDGAMNHLAVGGLDTAVMSMSVGTSGALRIAHHDPHMPKTPSTWCYYFLEGTRLAGAAVNNGTNCVDWFLKTRGKKLNSKNYRHYSQATLATEQQNAPFFMPFLYGERCPGWQENRSGGFARMTASHNEYDLYYAVLEGVLFSMRQCYDILVDVGGKPGEIVVSGGIVNSDVWMQMAADIFQRELVITDAVNDSTIGGALVAAGAVGGESVTTGLDVPKVKRFLPSESAITIYGPRYEHYLDLYKILG